MDAGNSGFKTRWSNYRHIVVVGSVNEEKQRSSFSTYGRFVDFVAPGENVTTLYPDNEFGEWNGTSFASPIAASVAALVLTANPELLPAQVLKIMAKTATRLATNRRGKIKRGRDQEYGYGLPDANAAIELALRTRGSFARRLRRAGVDPYIENYFSEYSGLLTSAAPGTSGALAEPRGFQSDGPDRTVPEHSGLLLLLTLFLLLFHRRQPTSIAIRSTNRAARRDNQDSAS